MKLWVEKIYPFVASIIIGGAWYFFDWKLPNEGKEFLTASLSLAAILTGFTATSKAILAALPSDSVMGRIRKSGYINELIQYLAHALYGCFIFCILCLAGFYILAAEDQCVMKIYSMIWAIMATFSALSFYRLSSVLLKIVKY